MKTIWSILIMIMVSFLTFSGISLIATQAGSNGYLDDDSINLIAVYDTQLANLTTQVNTNVEKSKNYSDIEPDNTGVGDFAKEFFETKDRVDQIKDSLKMFYKLPDLLLFSIPIIPQEDLAIYRNVIWFLISLALIVAIIRAIAQRRLADDG